MQQSDWRGIYDGAGAIDAGRSGQGGSVRRPLAGGSVGRDRELISSGFANIITILTGVVCDTGRNNRLGCACAASCYAIRHRPPFCIALFDQDARRVSGRLCASFVYVSYQSPGSPKPATNTTRREGSILELEAIYHYSIKNRVQNRQFTCLAIH